MSSFNPSRFANPNRTDDLTFPCLCPENVHEQDVVVVRSELGDGEQARAGAAGWAATGGEYFDWEAARDKLIEIGVVRWSFLDGDGTPVPVSARSASLLDEATRNAIAAKLDEVTARNQSEKGKPRPNPSTKSGGRSRTGTPARRSRRPKTPA